MISEKIKDEFQIWAKQNEDEHIFSEISTEEKSYYINRESEKNYLMEYSFHNMMQLKEALQNNSDLPPDSQILRKLTVEICQNKPKISIDIDKETNENKGKKELEEEKTLPEFVYVF